MVFCCWWWRFCCCFPYPSKFSKPASDEMSWYLRLVQLDGHYIKYLILTNNLILKPYIYFFNNFYIFSNVYIYIHVIIFVTQICNYKATFHMWRSTVKHKLGEKVTSCLTVRCTQEWWFHTGPPEESSLPGVARKNGHARCVVAQVLCLCAT